MPDSLEKAPYKIKVKNCPEWKDRRICSVEISVGNPNQEGEKLRSLLAWVNENFDACIINVADTLQRHNAMADGFKKGSAMFHAMSEGKKFLSRNAKSIESLAIPCKVIRWNDWLSHPDFQTVHDGVRAYYRQNIAFSMLVNADTQSFLKRNQKENEHHFMKSVDFILEEAAAHILMARTYGPVCVYPGKRLSSLDYIARNIVPETMAGLDQSLYARIVFDRRYHTVFQSEAGNKSLGQELKGSTFLNKHTDFKP